MRGMMPVAVEVKVLLTIVNNGCGGSSRRPSPLASSKYRRKDDAGGRTGSMCQGARLAGVRMCAC